MGDTGMCHLPHPHRCVLAACHVLRANPGPKFKDLTEVMETMKQSQFPICFVRTE
jgi:hypothetical protein